MERELLLWIVGSTYVGCFVASLNIEKLGLRAARGKSKSVQEIHERNTQDIGHCERALQRIVIRLLGGRATKEEDIALLCASYFVLSPSTIGDGNSGAYPSPTPSYYSSSPSASALTSKSN